MGRKLTNEQFLQKLKDLGRDDIEPLERYYNMHTKMKFRCTNTDCMYEWYAEPTNIIEGNGCPKCKGKKISDKLTISHEEFIRRIEGKKNPNIEILGEYKNNNTLILVRCKKDNTHVWEAYPDDIRNGDGCPFCRGMRVNESNSLRTLRPYLMVYLKNKEDGDKYTIYSGKKVWCKCPDCGCEKEVRVENLTQKGFSCPICGDGISYPNKFIRNMLDMFGIEFENEWTSSLSPGCFYDVKFNNKNQIILIEMDGVFHYEDRGYGGLKEVQEKDKLKNKYAKDNGWKLIRIEALQSDPDYLFNNIKNSELANILNLDEFDYSECRRRSEKSLMVEVCNYYNNHFDESKTKISKIFKLCMETVTVYLNRGYKIGLVKVNPKRINGSKIVSVYKDDKLLKTYISATTCSDIIEKDLKIPEIDKNKLIKIINSNGLYQGYYFKYAETLEDITPTYNQEVDEYFENIKKEKNKNKSN